MAFGMPIESWILLVVSVGLGLGLEIVFFRARRKDAKRASGREHGSTR